jgi:fucose permease
MAGFGMAGSFSGAALSALVLGMGGGGLNTSTNVLVSDVYGEKRGAMLNLLGIFFGIGALCIPLLAAVIAGHFTVVQLLSFCAVLALLCSTLFLGMAFPPPAAPQGVSVREMLAVARFPGVLLLAFVLFCQSGNEASIGGWTSTYMGAHGLPPRTATLVLAGYWAALMTGRLLAAQLLARIGKAPVIVACALGGIAGSALLLVAQSLALLAIGVVLIGVSYSSVFPTALAIAGDSYRKMAGTVFGLLFSIAMIGGMSFPWAVGQISQAVGVRFGMVVPLLGAAGILIASSLWLSAKKHEETMLNS